MSATARDVIAEELKDHGADFLGDSRDDIADAILSAIDAAGFAIVPKRPTEAMLQAIGMFQVKHINDLNLPEEFRQLNINYRDAAARRYSAMLAASTEETK